MGTTKSKSSVFPWDDSAYPGAFSARLRAKRKASNMSVEQLSETIHVSKYTIYKWESGQSLPALPMLYALSEILDVSTDELIKGSLTETTTFD